MRASISALLVLLVLAATGCTRIVIERPAPAPDEGPGLPPPRERPADPPPADPTTTDTPRAADRPIPTEFAEVRGVWVVRTSLDSPEEVRAMVADAHEAGFNTLLVQVRGRADAYWNSSIEPRPLRLAGAPADFDPLALVLREAHARGMKVHAWVVAHLVWGLAALPEDRSHLVRAHPDWLAVPRALAGELYRVDPFRPGYLERLHEWTVEQGGRLEGLYVNPALPEVRRRLAEVVREIALRYPVDGIHLDYVRYAAPEYDYSRGSLRAFRESMAGRVGPEAAARLDAEVDAGRVTAWPDAHPEAFSDFRRAQVTRAVREVRDALRAARPEATLSAAVFADPVDAGGARFQDWPGWLAEGLVDVVTPMAYTPDTERFGRLMEAALAADPTGRRVWPGLGIWQDSLEGALEKLTIVRAAGFRGSVLFSWNWAAFEAPSAAGESWLEAFARRGFGRGR